MVDIRKLKRLAEAATPGPWSTSIQINSDRSALYANVHAKNGGVVFGAKTNRINSKTEKRKADLRYAAAVNPQAILELIERLEIAEGKHVDQPERSLNEWFALTYAQFVVMPRVIMQEMPDIWQNKMIQLLDELDETFDYFPANGNAYFVRVEKSVEWPYEDEDGNAIEPILEKPDEDLCNYRHQHVEHRRKTRP